MTFGELVLWKERPTSGLFGKLTCMWIEGVLLGVKATSREYTVGTSRGVEQIRTVAPKPLEEREKSQLLGKVGGGP